MSSILIYLKECIGKLSEIVFHDSIAAIARGINRCCISVFRCGKSWNIYGDMSPIYRDFNGTRQIKRASRSTLKWTTCLEIADSTFRNSQFGRARARSRNEDWKGDVSCRDKTRESIRRGEARVSRGTFSRILTTTTLSQLGGLLWRAFRRDSWGMRGWGKETGENPTLYPDFYPLPLCSSPRTAHGNVGRPVERTKAVPRYS